MTATVTPEELQEHRNRDDVWIAIHGKVYNVTDFLDKVVCYILISGFYISSILVVSRFYLNKLVIVTFPLGMNYYRNGCFGCIRRYRAFGSR